METNDYESDFRFGKWLKDQRTGAGLTLEDASSKSGMTSERLKSLELGYAEKSVTQLGAERLAKTYSVPINKLIAMAIHSP